MIEDKDITVIVSDTVINAEVSGENVIHTVVGIQGPAGVGFSTYTHMQTQASSEWIINHNLDRYPQVQVMTTGLMSVLATIHHMNKNQVRIYFNEPQVGVAICT